jgi:formylglycine-generating enzyme required for sulfatase activity/serine/threonine protein kinase
MERWKRWLGCLGQAVWEEVPQFIAELVPFGERVKGIAGRFWRKLHEAQPDEQSRAALGELVTVAPAAVAAEALAIARSVAPDQTPAVQQNLAHYLELAPLVARQSLSRAEDPTGRSVPPLLVLDQPRNLLPFIPPAPPRFQPGDAPQSLGGWVLVQRLGAGGFGEVWQAQHPDEENLVAAVKFCIDIDEAARRVLAHEAKVTIRAMKDQGRALKSVVPLLDFNVKADPPWLKYEFVPGGDLLTRAAAFFGAGATAAIRVLAQIVGQFHRLNPPVVHRDLKPSNILVSRGAQGQYRFRITDFGIGGTASSWALDQDRRHTLPSAALPTALLGSHTPLYASPQQKQGAAADPRDDVFALGVLWYQLLCGNLSSERPAGNWRKNKKIAPLGLSEELLDLLGACCDDDPQERPPDAAVLAEAIGRCLSTRVPQLPSKPAVETAPPFDPPNTPNFAALANEKRQEQARRHAGARELEKQGLYAEALLELDCLSEHERDQRFYESCRARLAEATALRQEIEEGIHQGRLTPAYRRSLRRWLELEPFRKQEVDELLASIPEQPRQFANSVGMRMVLVPAGTFWMGGGGGQAGDQQVAIAQDFYLGIFPVTQGQWQAVMGNNPSWFSRGGGGKSKVKRISDADLRDFPVEQVSWEDAQVFLKRLNGQEILQGSDLVYRLPTAAEWEYACRGGAISKEDCSYHYYLYRPSNSLIATEANCADAYHDPGVLGWPSLGRTTKVGSYQANQLGIYDMHGNVWELCEDIFIGAQRVTRGGSWLGDATLCSASAVGWQEQSERTSQLGFRIAAAQSGSR